VSGQDGDGLGHIHGLPPPTARRPANFPARYAAAPPPRPPRADWDAPRRRPPWRARPSSRSRPPDPQVRRHHALVVTRRSLAPFSLRRSARREVAWPAPVKNGRRIVEDVHHAISPCGISRPFRLPSSVFRRPQPKPIRPSVVRQPKAQSPKPKALKKGRASTVVFDAVHPIRSRRTWGGGGGVAGREIRRPPGGGRRSCPWMVARGPDRVWPLTPRPVEL